MDILLASSSPRRKELLQQIGLGFRQVASDFIEFAQDTVAFDELVVANACGKAMAVHANADDIVIGADTVVVLDEKLLGKPKDTQDAKRMLRALSGRTHSVYTGICVKRGEQVVQACEKTLVTMRAFDDEEIAAYAATGEPLDKAGAYGIQGKGALLIEKIDGCYFNVVGLPLSCLRVLLEKVGYTFEY